jgi:hypothetical protein
VNSVLVCFNVLFAYVFDVVTGGKGMVYFRINTAKTQTMSVLLNETFLEIKCFNYEQLPVVNPLLVACIHALVIPFCCCSRGGLCPQPIKARNGGPEG